MSVNGRCCAATPTGTRWATASTASATSATRFEAVQLLGVLEDAGNFDEVLGLVRLVLDRLKWGGHAVSVDAIAAWVPLAAKLDPAPEPPAVAMTWLELEPSALPRTPVELERFCDWVRLASILHQHDPELLRRLGFPDRYAELLFRFAEQRPHSEPPVERDLRFDAVTRLALMHDAIPLHSEILVGEQEFEPVEPPMPVSVEGFPVERVLRDL